LQKGISDAGFEPLRINMKEHVNKICDEIIAEIRRSRFVVADYTGQRGGVYYEAGLRRPHQDDARCRCYQCAEAASALPPGGAR
jgi:hypothetical protein